MAPKNIIRNVAILLRPHNWIKNFFVFVPLFFAKEFLSLPKLQTVGISFIIFCLVASSVYIVNDLADIKEDQAHPQKQNRPIANGTVSPYGAILVLALLLAVATALILFYAQSIAPFIGIYFILNILYSFFLKHVAIIDILLVSSFYPIRILAGGAAAQVPISNWLLLCTIFIALFLIVGKRKAEIVRENKRRVLYVYTPALLDALLIISVALSIISYSLYTIVVLNSAIAVYSVLLVLLGILRYMLLIYTTEKSEYPERALLTDWWVLIAVVAWIASMYAVLYLNF